MNEQPVGEPMGMQQQQQFERQRASWDETALICERMAALDRTGQRLSRMIEELDGLNRDLERLDQILFSPGLPDRARHELLAEIDLGVGAYNHLREAAAEAYRQLVLQRESCGFRNHEVLRNCFRIPELHQPPEVD